MRSLRWIQRNALLAASILVACLAFGLCYTVLRPPEFTATTKAFVSTDAAASVTDLSQGGSFTQQVVKSYADVATTPYVLDPVIKNLGLTMSATKLATQITATAPLDTVVIQIDVKNASAQEAASIANAVTQQLGSAVASLTPTTNSDAAVRITQVQSAAVPTTPTSPNLVVDILASIALGLAIIGLLSGILVRLDSRLRTADEIETVSERPILGRIPRSRTLAIKPLVYGLKQGEGRTADAESFRTLRASLTFVGWDEGCRTILISSALPGEGKSTVAANLALALADSGQRVLLVDADLRRPRVDDYLQVDGSVGLVDVLVRQVALKDALQSWGSAGLNVLPAGSRAPNPSELLASDAFTDVLGTISDLYDVAIIDGPPLLPVSDSAIVARGVSGVLLVAAHSRVRRSQVRQAVAQLDRAGARLVGTVVTFLPTSGWGSGYEYHSQYGYYSPTVDA